MFAVFGAVEGGLAFFAYSVATRGAAVLGTGLRCLATIVAQAVPIAAAHAASWASATVFRAFCRAFAARGAYLIAALRAVTRAGLFGFTAQRSAHAVTAGTIGHLFVGNSVAVVVLPVTLFFSCDFAFALAPALFAHASAEALTGAEVVAQITVLDTSDGGLSAATKTGRWHTYFLGFFVIHEIALSALKSGGANSVGAAAFAEALARAFCDLSRIGTSRYPGAVFDARAALAHLIGLGHAYKDQVRAQPRHAHAAPITGARIYAGKGTKLPVRGA